MFVTWNMAVPALSLVSVTVPVFQLFPAFRVSAENAEYEPCQTIPAAAMTAIGPAASATSLRVRELGARMVNSRESDSPEAVGGRRNPPSGDTRPGIPEPLRVVGNSDVTTSLTREI
jgi:hypothetical protein